MNRDSSDLPQMTTAAICHRATNKQGQGDTYDGHRERERETGKRRRDEKKTSGFLSASSKTTETSSRRARALFRCSFARTARGFARGWKFPRARARTRYQRARVSACCMRASA